MRRLETIKDDYRIKADVMGSQSPGADGNAVEDGRAGHVFIASWGARAGL